VLVHIGVHLGTISSVVLDRAGRSTGCELVECFLIDWDALAFAEKPIGESVQVGLVAVVGSAIRS
jgi:hypothetical protein